MAAEGRPRRPAGPLRPLASVRLAPFLSLPGDAYEIGSILITRLPPGWRDARRSLRGDDLFQQAERLAALPDAPWEWVRPGSAGGDALGGPLCRKTKEARDRMLDNPALWQNLKASQDSRPVLVWVVHAKCDMRNRPMFR